MNIRDLGLSLPTHTATYCGEANLLPRITDDQALDCIKASIWDGYQADLTSRAPWERRTNAAMDLAMQIQQEKSFPWPGASNVIFPLVTISALQFAARAYNNLIQGTDVVRYRIAAQDQSGELSKRAKRIGRHMSWQVLEEDEAWEEQHDKLLINLAVVGSAVIKTYWSPSLRHNVSELVTARNFVIDYYAKSIESAARATQIITLDRNDIYTRVKEEMFTDVLKKPWYSQPAAQTQPIANPQQANADRRQGVLPPPSDMNTPFTFLEQHLNLDLDGDGYAEPYIATMELGSKELVRLVARWDKPESVIKHQAEIVTIKPTHYFTKYSFIPSPDGGFYDMGFGLFLGPINETVNTGINQLLDNGTMQNSLGGFLGRGAKIRGGVYTMAPWEWKRVDSTGDDLRKNLIPFPDRQPSTVMFQLISLLINYANRLAGTMDQSVGESPGQNTPASTSRATLEEGMKVHMMIFKRVWRSLREEFRKLYQLNAQFLPSSMPFGEGEDMIRQEDYKGGSNMIAPVADPNIASTEMRLTQVSAIKQSAATTPGYDTDEVERTFLAALQVDNIDIIFPGSKKRPAGPDRFIAVEQLKQQGHLAKYKHESQRWANELLEEKRLNTAKIANLEAQAVQFMAQAQATADSAKLAKIETILARFDSAINAAKEYNAAVDGRLAALQPGGTGGSGTADGGSDEAGAGMDGMEAGPDDQSVQAAHGQVAASFGGAMGGGEPQQ